MTAERKPPWPSRNLIAMAMLVFLGVAAVLFLAGLRPAAHAALLVALVAGGVPLVWTTLAGLLRGRFAADIVAALAIVLALVLGEYFAGVIIVLMQSGGEALEDRAMQRASQSLEALLARAPRIARRRTPNGLEDIGVDAVREGDELSIRPGDMVPVDCDVLEGHSSVDQSALTGEPAPVSATPGTTLLSGSINKEGALLVRARHVAADSQYQQVVRLVERARSARAPIQRLADRYAAWFTPVTLVMCGIAWAIHGDPRSVLAVLVVATPCPLILATPVAVIAGIGRAARRGIIVRHGGAIEEVGRARVVVFDKTGTLTVGAPTLASVHAEPGFTADEVLRNAAALEQLSSHHLGRAIVVEAMHRYGSLPHPTEFHESAGEGVDGCVEGRVVAVGSPHWIQIAAPSWRDGGASTTAHVRINGYLAGHIVFADRLRDESAPLLQRLRAMGLTRTVMLTGDRMEGARALAAELGILDVRANLLPEGKVEAVGALRRKHGRVLMVGDGINDAPALAAASVGIAMGAHAPAAAAEAADVVLLVDDVGRVAEAIAIGRRTRNIALQSIVVGLGLSGLLMIPAALGLLAPAAGAVLQEAIDVAVILNALRAR